MYTDLFPFFFWAVWASGNDALGAVITAQFPIRLLTDFLCSQKHSKVSFELPEGFSVTAEKWQQQGMFRVTRNLSGYSESLAAGLPLRSRATCSNLVVFLVYSLYFMPYNLILLYSVVRPMPSNAAANLRLPFACSSARIICFFSMSSISSEASDVSGISSNSNVSAVTVSPSVCSTAKCTTRFSSLTLPPHVYRQAAVFLPPRQSLLPAFQIPRWQGLGKTPQAV